MRGGRAVRLATAPPKRPGCPAGSRWKRKQKPKKEPAAWRVNMYIGDLDEVGWLLKCGEGEERRQEKEKPTATWRWAQTISQFNADL